MKDSKIVVQNLQIPIHQTTFLFAAAIEEVLEDCGDLPADEALRTKLTSLHFAMEDGRLILGLPKEIFSNKLLLVKHVKQNYGIGLKPAKVIADKLIVPYAISIYGDEVVESAQSAS